MTEVKGLVEKLKCMRPLAEKKDELNLLRHGRELKVIFKNNLIEVLTEVESNEGADFKACVSFKDLYEILRNSVSEFVDFDLGSAFEVKMRNANAYLQEKKRLFKDSLQESFKDYNRRLFTMEAKKLAYILAGIIKVQKDSRFLMVVAENDKVTFELIYNEFNYTCTSKTPTNDVVAMDMDSVKEVYKILKSLEGYVDVYAENNSVIFVIDAYEIIIDDYKNVGKKDIPDTKYKVDLVTDDILEAIRIASKISKNVYLSFEEPEELVVRCYNKNTEYKKKMLCESDVPVGRHAAFNAKEMFEFINAAESDYLVMKFTENLDTVVIEDSGVKINLRSGLL